MQKLYAEEVERSTTTRARQIREVEESYSEAVTNSQMRLAEMRGESVRERGRGGEKERGSARERERERTRARER